MRNAIREIARRDGSWAGIPMPLTGIPLVLDPRFPRAEALMKIGAKPPPPPDEDEVELFGLKIRNRFWAFRRNCEAVVWEAAGGGVDWGLHRRRAPVATILLQTMMASDAWGVEQEAAAIDTLAGLLPHRMFKCYLLTGAFLETSKRSGVTYMFRRLRPTVALSGRDATVFAKKGGQDVMRILATLCLHPIGYYQDSWAGAMCPTDDVLAHLMLMRGDEAMFWRRANQHPPWRPEAGL